MSVQVACAWQSSDWFAHSSTFEHVKPLPVHPSVQMQAKPPGLSTQIAAASHGSSAHSSTLEQVVPSPAQPSLQVQVQLPSVLSQLAWA